jgi:hypothetical protein
MKERVMQEALRALLEADVLWPEGAPVVIEKPGDIEAEVTNALAKLGICALVREPDNLESVDGAADFVQSSDWTVTVYSQEVLNTTGVDCLALAGRVRAIIANQNPDDLWAEELVRSRIRLAGDQDGIVWRDVTFTGAYQSGEAPE